jgi:predicted nucleic acid-binding protein
VIVVSNSSPLITLARACHLDLLLEFYREIAISRDVFNEVTIAGAGLPGAAEVHQALWIRIQPDPPEPSAAVKIACVGLGLGERSAIYLACALNADLILIDEARARRAAKSAGLTVAGSMAVLERGARFQRVADLRSVYLGLLDQAIRFDHKLLQESLARLGLAKLD